MHLRRSSQAKLSLLARMKVPGPVKKVKKLSKDLQLSIWMQWSTSMTT